MITMMIIFFALFAVSLGMHIYLVSTKTQIGEEGHRNVILQNVFCIAEAVALIGLGLVWILSPGIDRGFWLFAVGLGSGLLLCGVVMLLKTRKESPGDLITERLSEVQIVPAGYHNRDLQLRGMSGGSLRTFMIRGRDKRLLKKIAGESDVLEVSYHTSTHRIEAIREIRQ